MAKLRVLGIVAGLCALSLGRTAHAADCNPPRILFVMDASSSMLQQISDGGTTTTKWQAVQNAVSTVFASYSDAAEYGLMTFPGPSGQCSTGTVTVQVAAGTSSSIVTTLGNLTIPADNQTPAGQSLVAASQYAGITNSANPNYVIFMTDGWQYCDIATSGAPVCATASDCSLMSVSTCPSCNSCQISSTDPACTGQNADGCFCVRSWPVKGVEALAAAGVPSYVVGFGSSTDVQTLNQAAVAGGTAIAGCDPTSTSPSCYLQATSPTDLTNALSSIVQAVVTSTCTGPCGIEGTQTCTGAGLSPCDAPSTESCQTACGSGTQTCVNDVLGPCEPACPDAGTGGGGGAGGSAGSAGAAATGGSGAEDAGTTGGAAGFDAGTAGPGKIDDSGDDGGCGCRAPGNTRAPLSGLWLFAAVTALIAGRRRKRRAAA
jgi:MYXO-CTERM domain-containing protein